MKKLLTYCAFILFAIVLFVLYGVRNATASFWEFYYTQHLDLLLSMLLLLISGVLPILEYERERLNGVWSTTVRPEHWKSRPDTYIAEGTLLLLLVEKRRYKGALLLDWKDAEGNLAAKCVYDLNLVLHTFRRVSGTSILRVRESKDSAFKDTDNARISLCQWSLWLSRTGKSLDGVLSMSNMDTNSQLHAEKVD